MKLEFVLTRNEASLPWNYTAYLPLNIYHITHFMGTVTDQYYITKQCDTKFLSFSNCSSLYNISTN
jgi:hypothetical protein